MALIDVEYFKRLPLGVNEKAMPPLEALEEFIETASEQVEKFCDRKFLSASRVEKVWGSGRNELIVDEYPVTALTSVTWVDTSGVTGTTDTSDLRFNSSGILEFINYVNGPWYQNRLYTITYVAGYALVDIPRPVKHAVALWASDLMRPAFGGPSRERPPELVPLTTEQITELLENYRRRRIG